MKDQKTFVACGCTQPAKAYAVRVFKAFEGEVRGAVFSRISSPDQEKYKSEFSSIFHCGMSLRSVIFFTETTASSAYSI